MKCRFEVTIGEGSAALDFEGYVHELEDVLAAYERWAVEALEDVDE